jgi:hypothetical protein
MKADQARFWFLAAILKHKFAEENDDDGAPPPKWDTPAEIIRWHDEELAKRLHSWRRYRMSTWWFRSTTTSAPLCLAVP